nr:hypothetical protein [Streptomyces sp. 846.5]
MPTAAYDPTWTSALLAQWAFIHHIIGVNERHAVSADIAMATTADEQDPTTETG